MSAQPRSRMASWHGLIAISAICVCLALGYAGPDVWRVTAVTTPPGGAFFYDFSPQGVGATKDPSVLVFSGKNILREVVVAATGPNASTFHIATRAVRCPAIPKHMEAAAYDHVGDVDVADFGAAGVIIAAPIEEPSYTRPAIAFFNLSAADGITFINYSVARGQHHAPWAAFTRPASAVAAPMPSARTQIVLSSEYDNVTKVLVYEWPSMAPAASISLPVVGANGLMHVQGGSVTADGMLVLSTDQHENLRGHDVFTFDISAYLAGNIATSATLVGSQRTNYTLGLAETEGNAVDAMGRLWTVTNFVDIDPAIYTYERA